MTTQVPTIGGVPAAVSTAAVDASAGSAMTADEKNNLLRMQKSMRKGGSPSISIVKSIVALSRNARFVPIDPAAPLDAGNVHIQQMLVVAETCRDKDAESDCLFLTGGNEMFMACISNAQFGEMMTATLDAHMSGLTRKSTGNAAAYEAYLEICCRISALKSRKASLSPFDEPLTKREEEAIVRFDARDDREPTQPFEKHYTNENAVSYTVHAANIIWLVSQAATRGQTLSIDDAMNVFRFIHHKIHEGRANTMRMLTDCQEFIIKGVSMKSFWTTYMTSAGFATEGASTRTTRNTLMTLSRLARLTTALTGMESLWGISVFFRPTMIADLYTLWETERKLESRNNMAESIIWYLALGKQAIMNPLTDDQRQSAETILCSATGSVGRDIRIRPNASPFTSITVVNEQVDERTDDNGAGVGETKLNDD